MIKLLIEEPVSYASKENDKYWFRSSIGEKEIWIYKNPTANEVEECCDGNSSGNNSENEIRVLIKGNDYYIASAYYFIHRQMAELLFDYNHIPYKSYDADFVVDVKYNEIRSGEISFYGDEKSGFEKLKQFIPNMISVGLLSYNMNIVKSKNKILDGITIWKLMGDMIL